MPRPDILRAELEAAVDKFMHEYQWAINHGHDRPVVDAVKVSGGGVSDPTHAAAIGQETFRRKVRQAARQAAIAIERLERGESILKEAFDRADNRSEPLQMLGPKPASRPEVRDAERARARSMSRGEGFGVG